MAEPLRHRQTKEAETDMFSLQPPRHIPTLPIATGDILTARRRFRGIADMAGPASLPGPVAIGTREPQDGTDQGQESGRARFEDRSLMRPRSPEQLSRVLA